MAKDNEINKIIEGGERIYKITDEDGSSTYSRERTNLQSPSVVSKSAISGSKFYEKADGSGYTDSVLDAVSVSLDQDTGKITVKAPQEYLDSEAFKNVFKESTLSQLSAAYKSDHDYKVPDPLDTTGESEITIPDLVSKYNDSAKSYVGRAVLKDNTIQAVKDSGENRNGIADRLTEDDVILMYSSPYEEDAYGDSLLAIPKNFYSIFENVKGFDKDSGTISKDDFLDNYWNMEKTSDADLINTKEMVEDYFKNDGFEDSEEFARMTAFKTFIDNVNPEHGFWNGARVTLGTAIAGITTGINSAASGVISSGEAIANRINDLAGIDETSTGNLLSDIGPEGIAKRFQYMTEHPLSTVVTTVAEMIPGVGNLVNISEIAGEISKAATGDIRLEASKLWIDAIEEMKQGSEEWAELSKAGKAVFAVADFGSELATTVALSVIVSKGMGVEAAATKVAKTARTAAKAVKVATTVEELVPIGVKLELGSEALLSSMSLNEVRSIINSAIQTKRLSAAGYTAAELLSQGFIDAAITDPSTFRDLVEGNFNDENIKYLLTTAAFELGGWTGGLALKAGAKKFAQTAAGKAMNAAGAKIINKISVAAADLNNRFHIAALGNDWIKNIKKASKRAAREANSIITEARRKVANAKGVDNILDAVNDLKKVENAIDSLQRAGRNAVSEYTNKFAHADLAGQDEIIGDLATEISKLEKAKGLSNKIKLGKSTSARFFSEETANYIGAKYQLSLLDAIEAKTGTLSEAMAKGRENLRKMLSEAAEAMGSDLTAKADEFLEANKKWWAEFNKVRLDQGLLNAAEIDELKASGLWGENGELYMRTQRVTGDPTYFHVRADGNNARKNLTTIDKYGWGSNDSFADPILTRYEAMVQAGVERDSQAIIEAVRDIPGIKVETLFDTAQTERVRLVKKYKGEFKRVLNKSRNVITESFSSGNVMHSAVDLKSWGLEVADADVTMDEAAAKLSRLRTSTPKITKADGSKAIIAMTSEEAADAVRSANTATLGDLLESYDQALKNASTPTGDGGVMINSNRELIEAEEKVADYLEMLPDKTKDLLKGKIREANELIPGMDEYGSYARADLSDLTHSGITKSNLPKIKTSDYTRATGLKYKDAPEWLKPYLSEKKGLPIDVIGADNDIIIQGDGRDYDIDDILELYESLARSRPSKAAVLDIEGVRNALEVDEAMAIYSGGPSLLDEVNRSILKNDKSVYKSVVEPLAEQMKKDALIAEQETILKDAVDMFKLYTGPDGEAEAKILQQNMVTHMDDAIDQYISAVISDNDSAKVLKSLIEQSGAKDIQSAGEYLLLQNLVNDMSGLRKSYSNELRMQYKAIAGSNKTLFGGEDKFVDEVSRYFEDHLKTRFNRARQALLDEGGSAASLVDKKTMFSQIGELAAEIENKKVESGVIAVQAGNGAIEYIETSPLVADLYSFSPADQEMGKVAKVFNTSSRIFRLNTTGINITSLVNQQFRDFGNAFIAGGMWEGFKASSARLEREWGPDLVAAIQRSDPDAYQQLLKVATETGEDLSTVAVKQVQARALSLSPAATETAAYRNIASSKRQLYSFKKNGAITVVDNAIDFVTDKLGKANELREQYLRKSVYMNAFNEALNRGETYEQALTSAQFAMNNATTNFSRLTVHLQALQKTVPYLGAAINGTKSFWRMVSVDPVGIASRFIGGLVAPTVAFTVHNLMDPEVREKYSQLAEYEKDENLIIGVGGTLLKIPIPQEMAPIIAPFRQFVEHLYGEDKHSFWELAVNDVIGLSPVDISGYYDLDMNNLYEDPTFFDRVTLGTGKLLAQLMPPPAKSLWMAAIGTDPYTGKKIDTRHSYKDEESGTIQIMDSSQSSFAQVVAGAFGGSAQLAEKIITSLFGKTGEDILDVITSAAQAITPGGEEGDIFKAFELGVTRATSPLTVEDYDRTKSMWNSSIVALFEERESIINDPQGQYQKLTQEINSTTDQEEKKKLWAQRTSLLEPWQRKVGNLIQRFQQRYGAESFDRFRLASVISLLNVNEQEVALNAADQAYEESLYYSGRNEAIQTLIDMGCDGAGDTSMLGYLTRNDNGEVVVKYNNPLEILAAQNAWYSSGDINRSYIVNLIEDGSDSLKSQIGDYSSKIKAAKSYDEKDSIKEEWNKKVVNAISPYVERMSVEAILGNDDIIKYLEDYIMVPSYWEKVKGRYVSSGYDSTTGTYKLDKNMGFIESYLRNVFGE